MIPPATPRELTPNGRLAWLRLARTENVGPITFFKLLERFGSPEAAVEGLPTFAAKLGRSMTPPDRATVERELETHHRLGARLIAWGEPDYPERLLHTADPPPVISVLGEVGFLNSPTVAMVGARNASAAGQRFAEGLAHDLGKAGFIVASGFARGVDAAAHRGALATGTVAVLAGGVDNVFPPENRGLYAEIAAAGVFVAEMPPGTDPKAKHFPRRNRVIAGISLGVVVVEAALRSGSLLTARMAVEEGRELFAVPGSPLDPRCRGSNDLLRQGATLTESAEDVVAALKGIVSAPVRRAPARRIPETKASTTPERPLQPVPPTEATAGQNPQSLVLEALGPTPVAVDELVRRCQLSPALISSVLLDLELEGRLERHPGQRVSLA